MQQQQQQNPCCGPYDHGKNTFKIMALAYDLCNGVCPKWFHFHRTVVMCVHELEGSFKLAVSESSSYSTILSRALQIHLQQYVLTCWNVCCCFLGIYTTGVVLDLYNLVMCPDFAESLKQYLWNVASFIHVIPEILLETLFVISLLYSFMFIMILFKVFSPS